ncbi:MAG: hypothetical protein V1782_12735, partial [Pseudomonadota bacterium]
MKFQRIRILLVFFLLVSFLGCGPQAKTRPWVDLHEINAQLERAPEKGQRQEGQKDGAALAQARVKDMSTPGIREHEYLKKGLPPATVQRADAGPDGVMLNFDNADIYEFIQVISEILGINYIVDPKVKGSVNIRSGQKIGRDQLFGVFQKIMHINGLDVRNEGDYYSIHPSKGGVPLQVYGPTESGLLRESSRLVVQIVPVVHLSSAEAQKLIEPYLSDVGAIHNLSAQNTLIIRDFESKVLD